MAEGKWIPGLHEGMPAVEAAREVLDLRLSAVRHHLPRAVHEAEQDVEHVHQLRVSTRRAGAALKMFSCLLPRKIKTHISHQLRGIRRAAGEARDGDVFLMALSQRQAAIPPAEIPGLDFLVGLAQTERMKAQTHLRQAAQGPLAKLKKHVEQTLTSLRLPEEMPHSSTLRDLAVPQLSRLLAQLEVAGSQGHSRYEHLHQIRIRGKRLRYAMEIFESCFDSPFRETFYPAVEAMQEILGLANDSFVAGKRLEDVRAWLMNSCPQSWDRYREGIDNLLRFHQDALPRQRDHFELWWANWQRTGAAFARALLLKGQGCESPPSSAANETTHHGQPS